MILRTTSSMVIYCYVNMLKLFRSKNCLLDMTSACKIVLPHP